MRAGERNGHAGADRERHGADTSQVPPRLRTRVDDDVSGYSTSRSEVQSGGAEIGLHLATAPPAKATTYGLSKYALGS